MFVGTVCDLKHLLEYTFQKSQRIDKLKVGQRKIEGDNTDAEVHGWFLNNITIFCDDYKNS